MKMRMASLTAVGIMAIYSFSAAGSPGKAGKSPAKPQATSASSQPHHPVVLPALPLPVAQTVREQNSATDNLLVEVTEARLESGTYVAYVRVVWGDLDDLTRKAYSPWDGKITLVGGTGVVDAKYHFNDGKKIVAKATTAPTSRPTGGKGGDVLVDSEGTEIIWTAAVHGAYDGLRVKITSAKADTSGTIKAGNFTVPFKVAAAQAPTAK